MKWKKTLKANGFELSSYSKAIQASAAEMESLEKEKKELLDELKDASQEELADIEADIQDVEKEINSLDTDLASKMEKYDKNRETYKILGDKLKASREAKKQTKAAPAPVPVADPAPVENPAPVEEPAPAPQPEPKKKGNGGAVLAIGLLVVGSIIGVNLLKKK
jgi:cell pole-organizing protein PopZ